MEAATTPSNPNLELFEMNGSLVSLAALSSLLYMVPMAAQAADETPGVAANSNKFLGKTAVVSAIKYNFCPRQYNARSAPCAVAIG